MLTLRKNIARFDDKYNIPCFYPFIYFTIINKGLTEELRARIEEKGTSPALLDRIIGYAAQISEANVSQETFKETTKELSEEAANVFNNIYEEAMGICKIASNYYQYEPLKKEQFTFSKIISNMNTAKKTSPAPIE